MRTVAPGTGINWVPAGGVTRQVVAKASAADYDVAWSDPGVQWGGLWAAGTYEYLDMVRDGAWTAIVINPTGTTDQPSPQMSGTSDWVVADAPSWDTVSGALAVVRAGLRLTAWENTWITDVRLWDFPATTTVFYDVVLRIASESTTERTLVVVDRAQATGTAPGWTEFQLREPVFVLEGTVVDVVLKVYNEASYADTVANYTYLKPNNMTAPTAGEIIHSRKALDLLRIHKTDADATDRSALLASIVPNSSIMLGGLEWQVDNAVDQGTWVDVTVTLGVQASASGVQATTFRIYDSNTLGYPTITDYWIGDSHGIQGLVPTTDANPPAVETLNDDLYGVDVQLNPAVTSPDWRIVAVSSLAAQGEQGEQGPQGPAGPGLPTGGTTGQLPVKASATDYDIVWTDPSSVTGDYLPLAGGTLTGSVVGPEADFGVVRIQPVTATDDALEVHLLGDVAPRLTITGEGHVGYGDGTANAPIRVDVLDTAIGPRLRHRREADGGLAMFVDSYSETASQYPYYMTVRRRGTYDATTGLLAGDIIGSVLFLGSRDATPSVAASITAYASENFTGATLGSELRFAVGRTGTTTAFEVMRLVGRAATIGGTPPSTVGTLERLRVNTPTTLDVLAAVQIAPDAATTKPLIMQGAPSQSAALTEWQSSAGAVLASISGAGALAAVSVAAGTSPAQSGAVRLGNAQSIKARNGALDGDVNVLYLTASNQLQLGAEAAAVVLAQPAFALSTLTADSNVPGVSGSVVPAQIILANSASVEQASLRASTWGINAFGKGALALATGPSNTAMGHNAGAGITSGTSNAIFGNNACETANVSTTVAVGAQALQKITTSGNTAVGYRAAYLATSASAVTVLGVNAGAAITTAGSNCTYVGANTGATVDGQQNTAVGSSAMQAATSTVEFNTALGVGALRDTQSSASVAAGVSAGRVVTSGHSGIHIGYQAGYAPAGLTANATTTGIGQTNVGRETGQNSTSAGNYAVAIGYRALHDGAYAVSLGTGALAGAAGSVAIGTSSAGVGASTTTANEIVLGTASHTVRTPGAFGGAAVNGIKVMAPIPTSTGTVVPPSITVVNASGTEQSTLRVSQPLGMVALGYLAGQSATTGSGCVFLGNRAGQSVTTGGANTFLGTIAGQNVVDGAQNVAVGYEALYTNVSNSWNVAVGTGALKFVTANANVAVGHAAGNSVTTGTAGIYIGMQSGQAPRGVTANGTTTGSSQINIGHQTGQNSTTATSGGIAIGYWAAHDGSYAVALGYNTLAGAAGSVAIGVSSAGIPASTTTVNEIVLGTASHTVRVPGASLAVGTTPATAGAIRLPNTPSGHTGAVEALNAAGDTSKRLMLLDGTDTLVLAVDGSPTTIAGNTTIGSTGVPRTLTVTSSLAVGTTPASFGTVRLPNNSSVYARNAGDSANIRALQVNAANQVVVGDGGYGTVLAGGSTAVTNSLAVGTTPADSGTVRIPNAGTIMARNYLDNGNVTALTVNSSNLLRLASGATGWADPTGTLARTTFDTTTATLNEVAQRLAALITDLRAIGLIST